MNCRHCGERMHMAIRYDDYDYKVGSAGFVCRCGAGAPRTQFAPGLPCTTGREAEHENRRQYGT
jgi:hypothetical protein